MNSQAIQLLNQALWLALILSGPPILAASAVGLIVAIFQSATQLQDQTVQYAAKFIVIVLTIFATTGLFGGILYAFTVQIFSQFPLIIQR